MEGGWRVCYDARGSFAEAGNWFPWQKFAVHGEIPIQDSYLEGSGLGLTSSFDIEGSHFFSARIAGTSVGSLGGQASVSFKPGIFSSRPVSLSRGNGLAGGHWDRTWVTNTHVWLSQSKPNEGFAAGSWINGVAWVVRRAGIDMARAELANSLKG